MAKNVKQRYISTSFWDDPWASKLPPEEKLLFLYFITNPLTNIAGIYEITIRRISFDTGINEEQVLEILNKFGEAKKIFYENDYIMIRAFPKHQNWNLRGKIKKGIEAILCELPNELLERLKEIDYEYPINNLSIPYEYERNYIDSDSDSEKERESDFE